MVEAHDEKKPARSRTWIVLSVLIAVIALAVAAAFIVPPLLAPSGQPAPSGSPSATPTVPPRDIVGTDAAIRAQGQFDGDVVEAEIGVNFLDQRIEGRHFGLDLVFGAEDVTIVLDEAAHAHQAMQRPRRLVAVAGAELAVAQRQFAV